MRADSVFKMRTSFAFGKLQIIGYTVGGGWLPAVLPFYEVR